MLASIGETSLPLMRALIKYTPVLVRTFAVQTLATNTSLIRASLARMREGLSGQVSVLTKLAFFV